MHAHTWCDWRHVFHHPKCARIPEPTEKKHALAAVRLSLPHLSVLIGVCFISLRRSERASLPLFILFFVEVLADAVKCINLFVKLLFDLNPNRANILTSQQLSPSV